MNASEVLVTGGTGSLGSRVVERLRAAGREARTSAAADARERFAGTCLRARGCRRPWRAWAR
jgi:uncharacterized protein YbjT (DUF2867 family)